MRLGATAVAVRHEGDPANAATVRVTYAAAGTLAAVKARSVVVAIGGWIARHVVRDLPAAYATAYAQFHHGPILVANVGVRNWMPFAKLGITAARWFDGFGFYVNVRQPMEVGDPAAPPFDPRYPAMLTFYVGFPQPGMPVEAQTAAGRARLFETSYAGFERQIRRQLQTMFGAYGFDAKRDIGAIVLNRWGHAYLSPQPGSTSRATAHPRRAP